MAEEARKYDLEERTYEFAERNRDFVKRLPKTTANREYGPQLVRSSGSVASNYIEANEALSRRDYYHRVKMCKKEAKESRLWLRLVEVDESNGLELEGVRKDLIRESTELGKIFGSIIEKKKSF